MTVVVAAYGRRTAGNSSHSGADSLSPTTAEGDYRVARARLPPAAGASTYLCENYAIGPDHLIAGRSHLCDRAAARGRRAVPVLARAHLGTHDRWHPRFDWRRDRLVSGATAAAHAPRPGRSATHSRSSRMISAAGAMIALKHLITRYGRGFSQAYRRWPESRSSSPALSRQTRARGRQRRRAPGSQSPIWARS